MMICGEWAKYQSYWPIDFFRLQGESKFDFDNINLDDVLVTVTAKWHYTLRQIC